MVVSGGHQTTISNTILERTTNFVRLQSVVTVNSLASILLQKHGAEGQLSQLLHSSPDRLPFQLFKHTHTHTYIHIGCKISHRGMQLGNCAIAFLFHVSSMGYWPWYFPIDSSGHCFWKQVIEDTKNGELVNVKNLYFLLHSKRNWKLSKCFQTWCQVWYTYFL